MNISPKARLPLKTIAIKQALPFIIKFKEKFGTSPSFREIAGALGKKSVYSVSLYLGILKKEGYIKVGKTSHRNIIVLKTN